LVEGVELLDLDVLLVVLKVISSVSRYSYCGVVVVLLMAIEA
jgi:hypothetical protein